MWILSIVSCLLILFTGSLKSEVCPPSDTESLLHPGYEYTYRFSSEAIAEAVGTTNDNGKILIQCDVVLSHTTDCFYSLQLNDCKVNANGGPPGTEVAWIADQPLSGLSKYPVLFSLVNGEVTEVYTDENDPIQFANIKRGALSAFVFKLSYTTGAKEELHTDIHGTCPLTSTPLDTSKGLVRTTKNMLQCAFPSRKDWQFSPYSMFWNMSFIQHIINSTTDCDYTIDINEKRLEKVYCKERHAVMFQSTSNTEVSVQSNIHYNMEYLNRNPVTGMKDLSSISRKTDIRYEYERTPDPTSNPENFLSVAKKLLAELVEYSVDEIRLLTIPQFTDFVAWIRSAKHLIPFLDTVKSCSYLNEKECTPLVKGLGMSYLKDALIQCNSIACFEAISYLVKTKDISGEFLNYYAWGNMHFSKPTIIKYIMSICHDTDSDLCWASLGSLIRRIYLTYPDLTEMDDMLLKDVAKNFHDNIGRLCVSADPNSKAYSLLLRNLKTVRNMGVTYLQLIPEGFQQLTDCVFKSFVPDSVRTFALETLRSVSPCREGESCDKIYNTLLPLLLNTAESTTLRALSYEHLIRLPQKYGFEEEIFALLKTDGNLQLKSYMASNLKSLFKDSHYLKKEEKFIKSMNQLLNDNDLSLNSIVNSPGAKSFSKINSLSVNLPFMPEEMKTFGLRTIRSEIYESSDVIPRYFSHEMIFEAFSKLINAFQLGGYSEGLEKVAIVFQRLVKDFNSEMPSFEELLSALKEAVKEFKPEDSDPPKEYNFHESILRNIRKLEQMYRTFKPKSKSFITGFSDLFGSTIGYFSSGNTTSLSKLLEIQTLLDDLERGLVYNSTRVLRVIEAYHQVPTMMGLPLNWTANGTLAFSWRSGLKMSLNREEFEIHSEGFTQPSAALTFLNRMVIDFPTITQIGVQANSSAYTSTQWKAKLHYSKNKKIFSFIKPSKSQKILELFRTNQLIKHDTYEEIEDWDIERTSSSHCTNDRVSSVLGLQACLSKSYPIVTSRVKPWALMAGWCKWQLHINPFDEKLEAYNIETVESSNFKSKELTVKFSTSGSENKREIFLKADVDESKGETKILVEVPELPDFGISYIQNSPLEYKEKRHSTVMILKLQKGHEYRLIYNEEKRLDQTGVNTESTSQPLQEEKALVYEYLLSLDTPYNSYRFSKENHKHGDDEKTKVLLSYENLNSSRKWLHTILPESFWESETKAWVQFQINWKGEKVYSQAVSRRTVCFIKDPKTVIDLNANSFEMNEREQININLTKTEIATGKLLSFANYTYDLWRSPGNEPNDKEIRTYNLTIARKSWAVEIQTNLGDEKFEYEISLKRAAMTPEIKGIDDSVGWWSDAGSQLYRTDEKELKLVIILEKGLRSGEDLTGKYPVLKNEDLDDLKNELIDATIKFYYPIASRQESLTLVGFLLFSSGSYMFRIQNDFVAESSYNDLKFTSHGVFKMQDELTSLFYKSYFMHLPTEAEVHQVLEASIIANNCFQARLKHKIDSEFFDMSTNLTYDCNSNDEQTHTLLLHLLSNSSYWDMLNLEINQIIEDVSSEYTYETCNFTHPSLLINVTADWTGKPSDHKKKVLFTCRKEDCQSTELLLKFLKNGKKSAKLIMPNDQNKKLLIEKITSSNGKKLKFRINYSDDEDDDSKDLQLKGEILDEKYHIWNVKFNVDTYRRVKSLLENAYESILSSVTSMAKDPYHPVNKLMKPSLKVPLYDYVQNLRKQVGELMLVTLESLGETLKSLRPFYEAPLILATNIAFKAEEIAWHAYNSIKDKSILIWAFHYFELPKYFNNTVTDIQDNIPELLEILTPDDRILRLEFVTGRILRMRNFFELPSYSLHGFKLILFPSEDGEIQPRYRPSKSSKIAMIFGPLHVYTFDGHVYDSAEYSSDCTFLLAHDLHKSSFTVLSDKNAIHILFPEMVVSVNGENEVFVNGSAVPSTLPIEAHNGKVVVRRSEVVEIWSPSLRVVCSSKDFLCVLELDTLHSGATFGLLGNADGSSRNKFTLPEGNITGDSLEFVSSYEVSGKSECQKLKLRQRTIYSHEATSTCSSQFRGLCRFDKSTLESFQDACKLDLEDSKQACYAAAGYSALCFYKNLKGTTNCNGKEQESKRVGQKLEVVFIAHEHHSLAVAEKKSSPYKGIEKVLTTLAEKFQTNGYSKVSFSVIGFGGKGARYQPTVHARKSSWVPLKILLDDLLKTLQFEGDKDVDVLDILKYALEVMGYDTFHSKVFIILTPKDKQSKNKKAIGELQQHLEKNGITLYTFSNYPSIEKGMKVFGVRADGHIFPSPKKNGTAFLDYPKGDLAKLTSATRGSVFLTKFVLSNSPASFFREFANEVWAKVRNEAEICRECSSVRSGWWWQVNECNIVHC
ncbi:Apolipoprotein B-100 [Araneus ventricosus]|uniref:Apolipoprotein B-100 n=1 Tax=Araneus ventricosus TaxID=182803 RepID=A0A4Y2C3B9_ARAVE|nr:Apolipoprotein B-100 [Araneus ventricosus]